MKQTGILFIVVLSFLLFVTRVCLADESLRYFPGLSGKSLNNFSVVSPDYVAAGGVDGLYYWDGVSWHLFSPPFPMNKKQITFVKAFSKNNIWIFYKEKSNVFYTNCFHYSNGNWRAVHMPQSNDLEHFSFLDSSRFFAAGHWGGLIYYDGQKARNIKNRSGVCFSFIQGFSSSLFFAAFRPNENKSYVEMYRVENEKWQKLFDLQTDISRAHFFNPDSAIVFDGNTKGQQKVYSYSSSKLKLIDSKHHLDFFYQKGAHSYFNQDKKIWRYRPGNSQELFPVPAPVWIIPLNDYEFLLPSDNGRLFYWGRRKSGVPVQAKASLFFNTYSVGPEGGRHDGLALYRSKTNNIEAYFTAITDNNMFIHFSDTNNVKANKDVLLQRNLLGFGKGERPVSGWDAGVFFADLDNDGDKDAILTAYRGGCRMYENTGNDRFEDVSDKYNFKLDGRVRDIHWIDLNNDNLLDFIVGVGGQSMHIFLNRGFLRFKDISDQNIIPDSLSCFQPTLADVDNDGDLDLFLYSNYDPIRYFENQTKLEKNAGPVFVDKSKLSPQLTTRFDYFPQSISFADYDNDGDLDLFLANRVTSLKLFKNNGQGIFTDVSREKGFHHSCLAYGSNWGDLDQDGFQDIFISAVGKNYIFWNKAGRHFRIDSLTLANNNFSHSAGSLIYDMDSDGDLDIVVANNYYGRSRIQQNMLNAKNFLKVKFINGNYVGAKLRIYEAGHCGDKNYLKAYREISLNTGFCSSTLPEAHFGLHEGRHYDLQINYPSGNVQQKHELLAGKSYTFEDASLKPDALAFLANQTQTLFYNYRTRYFILNLLIFLALLFIFNSYIYRRSFWTKFYRLFFLLLLISVYIIALLITKNLSVPFYFFIPIYCVLLAGSGIYFLINHYQRSDIIDEKRFELFDLLRQFGHNYNGLTYINHILFLANNADYKPNERQADFLKEFRYLKENTFPLLVSMQDIYVRLYPHRKFSGNMRLLHKSINNCMKKEFVSVRTLQKLSASLENLKESLWEMRARVEGYFKTEITSTLAETVSKFMQFSKISIQNKSGMQRIDVLIHKDKLSQIIGNILQNALEAMAELEEKTVDITISKSNEHQTLLTFRDYGKGLPDEQKAKLFEANFSTKNSSGLGLYHARKLLAPFGGEIDIETVKPDKGAIIKITLRLSDETNHHND